MIIEVRFIFKNLATNNQKFTIILSGCWDLNPGPPAPKAGALNH